MAFKVGSMEEGVILTGEFIKDSPTFEQEVELFIKKLRELQQQMGFSEFVYGTQEKDGKTIMKVIPAASDQNAELTPGNTPATQKVDLDQGDGMVKKAVKKAVRAPAVGGMAGLAPPTGGMPRGGFKPGGRR